MGDSDPQIDLAWPCQEPLSPSEFACEPSDEGLYCLSSHAYYQVQPIYIPYPQPGKKWNINRYGPVGLGIDLVAPAFTMQISNVEEGSPAAATGKLKKGQIIESINGQTLKDIDPRMQLANISPRPRRPTADVVEDQGRRRGGRAMPVLGRYSETWPLDCPKSDKIVRNLADLLAKQDKPRWGSVLFLLSTGEEKDLDVVRGWMKDFKGVGILPVVQWLMGPGVCEYYLRTGDERAAGDQGHDRGTQGADLLRRLERPRQGGVHLHPRRAGERGGRPLHDVPAAGQAMRRRGRRTHHRQSALRQFYPLRRPRQRRLRRPPSPKAASATTARPGGLALAMSAAALLPRPARSRSTPRRATTRR
jgi:hypothetical protein